MVHETKNFLVKNVYNITCSRCFLLAIIPLRANKKGVHRGAQKVTPLINSACVALLQSSCHAFTPSNIDSFHHVSVLASSLDNALALAMSKYMAKSHEEKLQAVKEVEQKKNGLPFQGSVTTKGGRGRKREEEEEDSRRQGHHHPKVGMGFVSKWMAEEQDRVHCQS